MCFLSSFCFKVSRETRRKLANGELKIQVVHADDGTTVKMRVVRVTEERIKVVVDSVPSYFYLPC